MATAPSGNPATHPIINSPYEEPQWHWTLDDRGVAQNPALPGRRPAMGIIPVPGPRTSNGRQTSFDEQDDELSLVNNLRQEVSDWRNQGYPNVSNATSRLLNHWRSNQTEPKLFFAQIEAIETLIYLYEAVPATFYTWNHLNQFNHEYNDNIRRLAVKMATGTGKTAVMALTIIWQSVNHALDPKNRKFTNRFAVITPGITVRDRNTRDLIPSKAGHDIYTQWRLVPNDQNFRIAVLNAKVSVTNFQALQRREITWGQASAKAKRIARMKTQTETDQEMIHRAMPELNHKGQIIVLNDEGHHCHNTESLLIESKGEDRKTADIWFNGIRTLRQANRLHSVIDFSATPMFIAQNGTQSKDRVFPWTISDFPLTDAIEAGMVKIPRVPVADDTNSSGGPIYRNLYANSTGRSKQRPDSLTQPLSDALHSLYNDYAEVYKTWEAATETPPVFIIVANDIPNAQAIFDYISGFRIDPTNQWTTGNLELLSNVNPETLEPLTPPKTILVHSRLDSEAQITGSFGRYLKRQSELYKNAYPNHQWPAEDKAVLREVLNTVGKKGSPGEQVRCVVSVAMLTEGWDTRTVTHALGFRRFGTQLLCEQVAGRSLRRVAYDNLDPETQRFPPEYAEIFGIPFNFAFTQTNGGKSTPPTQTYEVKPVPERGEYRLMWPNITGYQLQQPANGKLNIEWSKFGGIVINSEIPEITEDQGMMGASKEIVTQRQRNATAIYEIARSLTDLLYDKSNTDDLNAPLRRTNVFTWSAKTTREGFNSNRIIVKDNNIWAAAQEPHLSDLTQRLAEACYQDIPNQIRCIKAITQIPPLYTTAEITPYWSSKKDHLQTKKSQLNIAPCSNSWELAVARMLDNHPLVTAWARNDRQRWQIPYMYQGQWQHYEPDFIARIIRFDEQEPLNIVIEVKGRDWPSDEAKRKYTNQYWIPAVNDDKDLSQHGKWQYLFVDNPDQAHMLIDEIAGMPSL